MRSLALSEQFLGPPLGALLVISPFQYFQQVGPESAVTRMNFAASQFGSPSFSSRFGGGSPRLGRFFSEDAERGALDVKGVWIAA